jgi:hypothetical protein
MGHIEKQSAPNHTVNNRNASIAGCTNSNEHTVIDEATHSRSSFTKKQQTVAVKESG